MAVTAKISSRLYILVGTMAVLLLVIGFLGLSSAKKSNQGLNTVFKDRVVPLKDLKTIADLYAVNIVDTSHKVRNKNISWQKGVSNVETATHLIEEKWNKYLATELVVEEENVVKDIKPLLDTADRTVAILLQILKEQNGKKLADFTIDTLYPVIDPVSDKFAQLVDIQITVAEQEYEISSQLYTRNRNISVGIILCGVVLSLGGSFMTIRSITLPLHNAVSMVETLSRGDFSTRISTREKNEIGKMVMSLDTMSVNLGKMIQEVVSGVSQLSASSSEMNTVAQQLMASAGETSAKSNTVSQAAEQMNQNTQSVSAAMEQSSSNINMIARSIEEMTATVNEIAQNAEKARAISENAVQESASTSGKMASLGESAQRIGRVTETITEISEQTNLLALNATIEAARAGEAGKGFAVVANEIKELARQTAEATVDIKNQIGDIQKTASSSISGLENVTSVITEINNVINGIATAVEEQSAATGEVAGNITQASQGIGEVNEKVAQSTVVVSQISQDIEEINRQTDQVGEGSNHVQQSAQKLAGLASQLDSLMRQFKV
nr:HAMP domain-containing methyl-accepting chemotaxis protein [uncultured Desulfobulbus sp.]